MTFQRLLAIGLALASLAAGLDDGNSPSLGVPEDFVVSRDLLEKHYPAFESYNGTMHSGLMPAALVDDDGGIDEEDASSYFFWMFQPDAPEGDSDGKDSAETFRDDTLIVWLNGGPGCSSLVGLLAENGPVTLPKWGPGIPPPNPMSGNDAPFVENPYGWTKKSAMLFVEQPGGTGFSTASKEWTGVEADERTEDDVAEAFYAFLQNLFRVFEEDGLREKRMYIAGESYAGMYIPSIARGIHLRNKDVTSNEKLTINLRGVAIGNGWIDAYIQGATTIDYAFWHGMIDLRTYRGLHEKWDQCVNDEIKDSTEDPFHPFNTPDECGVNKAVMAAAGTRNPYDVTTFDIYPAIMNVGASISRFFNVPDIRTALNAPSIDQLPLWRGCVPGSGRRRRKLKRTGPSTARRDLIMLDDDRPLSVVPYIADLLDDANIDVLMYNGDLDLACSSQSTEMALESMRWSGRVDWMDPNATKWMEWVVDGQVAGRSKKYRNLEFVTVYNSGHFVPINQARNSLNLIGRLLDGKSFGDEELPQFPAISRREVLPLLATPAGGGDDGNHLSQYSYATGVCGFLLGVFVSYAFSFSGREPRGCQQDMPLSTSSSPYTTETTPLNRDDA